MTAVRMPAYWTHPVWCDEDDRGGEHISRPLTWEAVSDEVRITTNLTRPDHRGGPDGFQVVEKPMIRLALEGYAVLTPEGRPREADVLLDKTSVRVLLWELDRLAFRLDRTGPDVRIGVGR